MSQREKPRRIGSFTIEQELAVDELGAWFRARDERLGRPVALRVWRLRGARSKLAPLIRERARAAAAIAHSHLPTVFGREEMGVTDLLSMEFIEGDTLADLLASGMRWRPLDAARLLIPVADALAVAHAADVTHGRLTAKSIRLTRDGRPVLLGLGVARSEAEAEAPVGGAVSRHADVRALAGLIALISDATPTGGHRTMDPMLAVEARVLEPVLSEAGRERSKRLPDAAALRDALISATAPPGRSPRRSTPPPEPVQAVPAGAAATEVPPPRIGADASEEPARPARPRPTRRTAPVGPPLQPSVLIPEQRRAAGERHPGRRLAGGLVLGALLAAVTIGAWRSGAIPVSFLTTRDSTRQPFEGVEPVAVAPPRESAAAPDFADTADFRPQARDVRGDTALLVTSQREIERAAPTPPPPPPPPPAEATPPESRPPAATDRTASVSVSPGDAIISRVSDGEFLGMGSAQLSIADGESMRIALNRQGYVAEERLFTGEPIDVTLRPDSVNVSFVANIPAEVVIDTGDGQRVLGTTNLEARLPTGEYRVHYRPRGQDEWSVLADFPRAGSSYRVSKMDFATRGSVVIAVQGGWARVSVNGGPERETPARFDDLPHAPHIVRLSREGYETIVDTITISPGQVVTRQYQLRPIR